MNQSKMHVISCLHVTTLQQITAT